MYVRGKMYGLFDIDSDEIIEALLKEFGIEAGKNYCVEIKNGIPGIYYYKDISIHGSPEFQYTLIHKGEEAIKVYEILMFLKNNFSKVLENKGEIFYGKK